MATKDEAPSQEVETRILPIEQIDDPAFNSRMSSSDEVKLGELARSMREVGLINPILVTPIKPYVNKSGMRVEFELIAGSRRLRAARLNGWTSIRATVEVRELATMDKVIRNIKENLEREDLSTYEIARSFAELDQLGMTVDQIVESTNYGKSRVYSLLNQYKLMPEELRDLWQARDPVFTPGFLEQLTSIAKAGKGPSEMKSFYIQKKKLAENLRKDPSAKILNGADSSGASDSGDEPNANAGATKSVKVTKYAALRKALNVKVKDKKIRDMAVAAIDYLMAQEDEVPGVIEKVPAPAPTPPPVPAKGKPGRKPRASAN